MSFVVFFFDKNGKIVGDPALRPLVASILFFFDMQKEMLIDFCEWQITFAIPGISPGIKFLIDHRIQCLLKALPHYKAGHHLQCISEHVDLLTADLYSIFLFVGLSHFSNVNSKNIRDNTMLDSRLEISSVIYYFCDSDRNIPTEWMAGPKKGVELNESTYFYYNFIFKDTTFI